MYESALASDVVSSHDIPILITVVHGTFARGADWTKEGSELRRCLTEALGAQDRTVIFDVFEWSGRNSHKARIQAGYQLSSHICRVRKLHPKCRHFIIAHSHGGNIALLAHKHLPEALHVRGIATLGTPFLHAKLRDDMKNVTLKSLQREADGDGDVPARVLAFLAAGGVLGLGGEGFESVVLAGGSAALAFLITYLIVRFILFRPISLLSIRFGSRVTALRLAEAIQFPRLPRTHVLSFVYPQDEAGCLLDTLELTTRIPTWLMRATVAVGMVSLPVVAYFSDKVGLLREILDFSADNGSWEYPFDIGRFADDLSGFTTLLAGALAVLWLGALALRHVLALLRGHPAGFGWERPGLHHWVDVGASPKPHIPFVRSNFTEFVPVPTDPIKGYRHNHMYKDRRILRALSYWMASTS